MKKIAVLMFAALVMAGCTNQKFKPEYRTQIHTVKVMPATWDPKAITYTAPGKSALTCKA